MKLPVLYKLLPVPILFFGLISAGKPPGSVAMELNVKTDTLYQTLEDFNLNDSIVFSRPEDAGNYKLVDYELRLLARPKELYHTVIRKHELPNGEISRYYTSAPGTVTVFFSDIRIQNIKSGQVTRAKAFKCKIYKAK